MLYFQYAVILLFSVAGILTGGYAGVYMVKKDNEGKTRSRKIKRYIPEPSEATRERDESTELSESPVFHLQEELLTELSYADNRVVARIKSKEELSRSELEGMSDEEITAEVQRKMKNEKKAYSFLKNN